MRVTVEIIRNDIIADRFAEFVKLFPDMLGFFADLRKKPKCDSCVQKMMVEFNKQRDLEKNLKKLYGFNSEIDSEVLHFKSKNNAPNITSSQTEVFVVAKNDYGKFMMDFAKDKIIRVIDTLYISEEKEIVVTIVYNTVIRPI